MGWVGFNCLIRIGEASVGGIPACPVRAAGAVAASTAAVACVAAVTFAAACAVTATVAASDAAIRPLLPLLLWWRLLCHLLLPLHLQLLPPPLVG